MSDVQSAPSAEALTQRADAGAEPRPRVSIIMANYNGARYIEAALASARAQSLADIEIIVADDASTDHSRDLVAQVAAADKRVVLLSATVNAGAASARNRALAVARGEWIAVMDSDDLIHPDRFTRLLAAAETAGADIVADDMLVFDDTETVPPYAMLRARDVRLIDTESYIRANALAGQGPALGYLKPMIRAEIIARAALRYDETLPIAEDYAFVLALLARGARFAVTPELTYFYRKHGQSLSHRLSVPALRAMCAADDAFRADASPAAGATLAAALDLRRRTIEDALGFEMLMAALKRRDLPGALGTALRQPRAAALLRVPLRDRARRLAGRLTGRQKATGGAPASAGRRKSVCLISRQRVVGAVNGSSVYLLSLCGALRDSGMDVHLVSPSPLVFGSWPVLVMRPEMDVFSSIQIRGAWRLGRLVIARDPSVALRAAYAVVDRLARRVGLSLGARKAPYAIASPWQTDDFLFVARHARRHADAILADYAFLTAGIPYALRPEAPSGVVMHDLFSSHGDPAPGRPAPLVRIERAREMALLAGAGAVIAIQTEEAAAVSHDLPDQRVILAPMAAQPVAAAQPGAAHTALFVGSNTEPNIKGLQWFLDEVWPAVRSAVPDAQIQVAGGVVAGIAARPAGVSFLGLVPDLAPYYRDAGIVVSPLRFGSGLKIKLVEALANGKAAVVTSVTMQGVEDIAGPGVIRADTPQDFAAGMIALMQDDNRRSILCEAALGVARAHFAPGPCYRAMTDFFADLLSASALVS